MIGLVDCNSFYILCGRIFQPQLRGVVPCIILSKNDANVVARSQEAKAVKIPMGALVFKIQHLIHRHQVQVRSSNYELYGDISDRVMAILREFSPTVEVYYIDEAFIDLGKRNSIQKAREIRHKARQWIGVPVSIGVAQTKLLSKVGHQLAKQDSEGVFVLRPKDVEIALIDFQVEDIWGIPRGLGKRLRLLGITTVLDHRNASESLVRQHLGVVGARIQLELRGFSCMPLEVTTR